MKPLEPEIPDCPRGVRTLRDIKTLRHLTGTGLPWGPSGVTLHPAPAGRSKSTEAGAPIKVHRYKSAPRREIQVEHLLEPTTEALEQDDELVLVVQLTGAQKHDVALHIQGDVLIVAASVPGKPKRRYYREIVLPYRVATKHLRSTLRNGVLQVRVSRPRQECKC